MGISPQQLSVRPADVVCVDLRRVEAQPFRESARGDLRDRPGERPRCAKVRMRLPWRQKRWKRKSVRDYLDIAFRQRRDPRLKRHHDFVLHDAEPGIVHRAINLTPPRVQHGSAEGPRAEECQRLKIRYRHSLARIRFGKAHYRRQSHAHARERSRPGRGCVAVDIAEAKTMPPDKPHDGIEENVRVSARRFENHFFDDALAIRKCDAAGFRSCVDREHIQPAQGWLGSPNR
jgi:hypothetical protein